jgi:uncharacterized membrane protein YdcZ (DUF606 family)
LDAGTVVGLVVTGQLLFAVSLGFDQHDVTMWRGVGCLLMIGGVTLIAKF